MKTLAFAAGLILSADAQNTGVPVRMVVTVEPHHGVEMPRLVLLVVHPNDDSEEHGNDWHRLSIASSMASVGPTTSFSRGGFIVDPRRRLQAR